MNEILIYLIDKITKPKQKVTILNGMVMMGKHFISSISGGINQPRFSVKINRATADEMYNYSFSISIIENAVIQQCAKVLSQQRKSFLSVH